MKDLKNIAISIAIVAPFFIAIVVINHYSEKGGWLQGEYDPLWYIVPILAALVAFLIFKTRD